MLSVRCLAGRRHTKKPMSGRLLPMPPLTAITNLQRGWSSKPSKRNSIASWMRYSKGQSLAFRKAERRNRSKPVTSRAMTRLPQSEIELLRKHSVDQAARFKAMLRAENA